MKTLISILALAALTGCGTMSPEAAAVITSMGEELARQGQTGTGVFTRPQVPVNIPTPTYPNKYTVKTCSAYGTNCSTNTVTIKDR
jgi:hypothetical protein